MSDRSAWSGRPLAMIIGTPVLLVGMVVGLVIGLFQALTQVQDQTIAFVPKIVAIFLAVLIGLPFMSATLGSYMARVVERITAIG